MVFILFVYALPHLAPTPPDRDMQAQTLRTDRKCCVCGVIFQEMRNIGAWRCYQHPGTIRDGVWTCCNLSAGNVSDVQKFYSIGRSNAEKGCVRCDHRVTFAPYNEETGLIKLSKKWYHFMQDERLTTSEALVEVLQENVILRRYDIHTENKLHAVMMMHSIAVGDPSMKKYKVTGSLSHKTAELERKLAQI